MTRNVGKATLCTRAITHKVFDITESHAGKPYLTARSMCCCMMFPRGQHPMYSFSNESRQQVLAELGISETCMKEYVNIITEWFQKQPHLAEAGIHPDLIEMYLMMAKGSVEKAKSRIDAFYKLRASTPEFFANRIKLLETHDKPIVDKFILAPIPKLYNGKRVTIVKNIDPDNVKTEEIFIKIFLISDIRLFNDCCPSIIWIFDLDNITINHLLKVNLHLLHKASKIMHDGIGTKVFQLHFINCSVASLAQTILSIFKPFLSKKIHSKFNFHESIEDLHKYVPKEYLPKDYGGDCLSLEEYKENIDKLIMSADTKKFLIDTCKMVSDESKRPKPEHDDDYLPGTFKKLDLD